MRRKATTAKSKHTPEDFAAVKQAFLDDVLAVATMEDVPPELVLNWDQTGIHLVPASTCGRWIKKGRNALKSLGPMTNDKSLQFSVEASLVIFSHCS